MSQLPTLIADLALILICAGIMTLLFKKLKQPLVLGYVVAGFLASPHMPYTPSVMDTANIKTWADIGVIFLLFALGLEFSFKKIVEVGGSAIIAACTIIFCMILLGIGVGMGFGWHRMDSLFLGGMIAMSSTTIIYTDFDDRGIDYLAGQKLHYTLSGIGMTLQYDSRDFIPAPERGTFLMVKQVIYPKGLGNSGKTLYKTTATADYYQRLWRGAVLATDIFGEFNSSGMPWCMLAELGGGYRMRGYYLGRYIDNNILSCQIEYRQRIWRRIGCAVWGGAGNVFSSFERFRWDQTLPNYGLGLRWEFKRRVNVRIDYGFGRKTSGLVFNINEAF